jgi:hypothetical protein
MKNKILLAIAFTSISVGAVNATEKQYLAGSGETKNEACHDAERGIMKKADWHCEKIGGSVSSALFKKCNVRQYDSGKWTASIRVNFESR